MDAKVMQVRPHEKPGKKKGSNRCPGLDTGFLIAWLFRCVMRRGARLSCNERCDVASHELMEVTHAVFER